MEAGRPLVLNAEASECGNQLLVRKCRSTIAGLQVGKAALLVLFGEGVYRFLGNDNVITEAVGVGRGVTDTHMGV